jgi:hypothetical protein
VYNLIAAAFSACKDDIGNPDVERYTIAAGRAAILQKDDTQMPTIAVMIQSPSDTVISAPYINRGFYIVKKDSGERDEEDNPVMHYGISDTEGNLLAECIYKEFSVSGDFILCVLEQDQYTSYDLYYKDGAKLFNTENAVTEFTSIDNEYFALYTDTNSEVFDKNGDGLFGPGRQLSSDFRYSVCGKYLFGHNPKTASL